MIQSIVNDTLALSPSDPGPRRTRIMLVDDHLDSVVSMGRLLKLMGYEVRAALDGMSALQCAEDFNPDVALIDLSLPGLDGYSVARRIRDSGIARGTRLI